MTSPFSHSHHFTSCLFVVVLLIGCSDGTSDNSSVVDAGWSDQGMGSDMGAPDALMVDAESMNMTMQDAVVTDAEQPDPMTILDAGLPDQGEMPPPMPEMLPQSESIPADAQRLIIGPSTHWVVLKDGGIIFQRDDEILHADGAETTRLGSHGNLIDAMQIHDTTLVLTTDGLFAIDEDGLSSSPIGDVLDDIVLGLASDGDSGWFIGHNRFYRWSDGSIWSVNPGLEIDWNAAFARPGHYAGQPVLWLGFNTTLIALGETQMAGAWQFDLDDNIQSMSTNQNGLFMLMTETFRFLDNQGVWHTWSKPEGATQVMGNLAADSLWLTDGTVLWQLQENTLIHRSGAPEDAFVQVDGNGNAYLESEEGVDRVLAGRILTLAGLNEGHRLGSMTTVTIEASDADEIATITYQLNDEESITLAGDQRSIDLQPEVVGPGHHTLSVEVAYNDGLRLSAAINFLGPPTWEADIQPIHLEHCTACHGSSGLAHPMDDLAAWRLEIADIIDDVETGRMPYGTPMLSPSKIELIRMWRDTGLLER